MVAFPTDPVLYDSQFLRCPLTIRKQLAEGEPHKSPFPAVLKMSPKIYVQLRDTVALTM
jgi:hypothetical protein